jgi:hypothetical protein
MNMPNRPAVSIYHHSFMTADVATRLRTLNNINDENPGGNPLTHIRRWREINKPRLTNQQLALTDE